MFAYFLNAMSAIQVPATMSKVLTWPFAAGGRMLTRPGHIAHGELSQRLSVLIEPHSLTVRTSNPATFRGTAAIVRNGRYILNLRDIKASGLQ